MQIMTVCSGILAGCAGGGHWLRVVGKGSHANGPLLKTYVRERAVEGGSVVIDLAECTGMDSSFMGMLAGLAGLLETVGGQLRVVNAGGRNGELLRGLGLDAVFPVQDGCGEFRGIDPECVSVEGDPCARAERARVCLEAHEVLARVDERNAEKFRDVIDLMRAEVARELVH